VRLSTRGSGHPGPLLNALRFGAPFAAYVYPYLLAFTPEAIYVCTLINGNLVKVNSGR
jgi:hypothetical protein